MYKILHLPTGQYISIPSSKVELPDPFRKNTWRTKEKAKKILERILMGAYPHLREIFKSYYTICPPHNQWSALPLDLKEEIAEFRNQFEIIGPISP